MHSSYPCLVHSLPGTLYVYNSTGYGYLAIYMCVCIYVYPYMHIYICLSMCVHIYIYMLTGLPHILLNNLHKLTRSLYSLLFVLLLHPD